MAVHLLCVVSIGAICKRIVRRWRGRCGGEVAMEEKRDLLGGDSQPGPASCASEMPQSVALQHGQCDDVVK
jgi:hypothetical protein